MKKLVLLSVVSFALILVATSTSNAQGGARIAVEVVRQVFEPKPLNKGERDYEKQPPTKEEKEQFAREQRELREQREQRDSSPRREPDRDCTRGGRRGN